LAYYYSNYNHFNNLSGLSQNLRAKIDRINGIDGLDSSKFINLIVDIIIDTSDESLEQNR
jgi:hypothetical protein